MRAHPAMKTKRWRGNIFLPGVRSNNIYVVDTATDPLAPRIHTVIDGNEIK